MRQVYYDPFGMRLAGQQAGIRDEAFLQDQTRQARASDYNFNVMQPIDLHNALRASDFADYADPYARRNLGYTEQATKRANYLGERDAAVPYMLSTGDQGPLRQLDYNRYAPDSVVAGGTQERLPHKVLSDYIAQLDQEGIDPESPLGIHISEQTEAAYGLPRGYLRDPNVLQSLNANPMEAAPQQNLRYNPYTGQMEAIPNNPNGYMDFGMQPYALQRAQLELQRQLAGYKGEYNDIFRDQTENSAARRAGSGNEAPAYEAHLGD